MRASRGRQPKNIAGQKYGVAVTTIHRVKNGKCSPQNTSLNPSHL
jgi:hypothetical protein